MTNTDKAQCHDKRGEQQAAQVSLEDQCAETLRHYEYVCSVAHEWHNQVPQAIKAWYAAKGAQPSHVATPDSESKRKGAIALLETWIKEAENATPEERAAEAAQLKEIMASLREQRSSTRHSATSGCTWHSQSLLCSTCLPSGVCAMDKASRPLIDEIRKMVSYAVADGSQSEMAVAGLICLFGARCSTPSARGEPDLLPGLEEALAYFVGTRGAQAVYDNIKARIAELRRADGSCAPKEKP